MRLAIPDLISNSYFTALAAAELGHFARHGLDIQAELIFPVDRAYEAMRDGEYDFVAGAHREPAFARNDADARGCNCLRNFTRSEDAAAGRHRRSGDRQYWYSAKHFRGGQAIRMRYLSPASGSPSAAD